MRFKHVLFSYYIILLIIYMYRFSPKAQRLAWLSEVYIGSYLLLRTSFSWSHPCDSKTCSQCLLSARSIDTPCFPNVRILKPQTERVKQCWQRLVEYVTWELLVVTVLTSKLDVFDDFLLMIDKIPPAVETVNIIWKYPIICGKFSICRTCVYRTTYLTRGKSIKNTALLGGKQNAAPI